MMLLVVVVVVVVFVTAVAAVASTVCRAVAGAIRGFFCRRAAAGADSFCRQVVAAAAANINGDTTLATVLPAAAIMISLSIDSMVITFPITTG